MTAEPTLPTCVVHHDRQTRLACARCGRPVCDICLQSAASERDGAGAHGVQTSRMCPDCRGQIEGAAAARATPVPAPAQRGAPVSYVLLAALAVVFLLGAVTGGDSSPLLIYGAQINPLVMEGEWWRVLSATLLHAGPTHLLFNGYALYALGPQLERGVGSLPFAALYLASALAGGLAFLLSSPGEIALGASGAIFGLFGAWFAASWVNRDTPHGRAGFTQFGVLLLINLALPLFIPNIAWQTHLGGLVVGAVSGWSWARRNRRGAAVTATSRAAVPLVLSVVGLLVLLWYT